MAVSYKPHSSGKTLLIGGQSTTGGTSGGLVGPFPKFSINREELSTGDGTHIGTKFTIDITGTATINENDNQDITVKGQRQNAVMGETITALQFDRDIFPSQGTGLLEIVSYGGLSNVIKFSDARLISVSLPEQTDESAGIQGLEYSFSFEAYEDDSSNYNNGNPIAGSIANPTYRLSSAEENWELSENEGTVFFKDNNPTGTLQKTFTLTHTLSATGLKKYDSQGTLATDGEAWKQAANWVSSRLKTSTSITSSTTEDPVGGSQFWVSQFVPINMNKDGDTGIMPDFKNSTPSYKGYNHVRTASSDITAGSYSVTETWFICADNLTANHEIEVSVEDDQGVSVNVSISATFQGLDSGDATSLSTDKYSQANISYTAMKNNFYTLATSAYSDAGFTGLLRNQKISESFGQNRTAGTITYSVTYNDASVSLKNAISEDININYDNTQGLNEVIAKIPIIGKDNGPIIQDMDTTTIKIVSASLDAVMNRSNRVNRPLTEATTILEAYKPTNSKQQTKTESWNPKTGAYNLSMSWEYN